MSVEHKPVQHVEVKQELEAMKIAHVLDSRQEERRERFGKAAAIGFGAVAAGLVVALTGGAVFLENPTSLSAAAGAAIAYGVGSIVAEVGLITGISGLVGRAANRPSQRPHIA